eukprot:UN01017
MSVLREIKLKLDQNKKYVNELKNTSLRTKQSCDCQNIFKYLDDVIEYEYIMDLELKKILFKSLFLPNGMKQQQKANEFINNMEAKINNLNQQVSDLNKRKNEQFFNNINKLTYCLFDLKLFLKEMYKSENQEIISHQNENRQNLNENRQNQNINFTLGLNGKCWNCELTGHKSYQCPYPVKKCSKCHHVGHNTSHACRMYWRAKRSKLFTRLHPITAIATITIYNVFGRKSSFGINLDYIPQHLNLKSVFKTIGLKYFWIINLKNRNVDRKIFDNSFNIQLCPGDHIGVIQKHDVWSRVEDECQCID